MSFEYDTVGNRTKRTDYIGRVTNYTYDNLNRLTQIGYASGAASKQYSYDDLSRLISAINEAGTVSVTYDNRGRLRTETDVFGHVTERFYDAASRRTELRLDGASYATYAYDIADRLTGITNVSDSTTIGFGYDNANRLSSRTYPNGVITTYEYDGMSRLTRLRDGTLFDRQYSYNSANQISQIVEPTLSRVFGYDNVDQLTSVTGGVTENYAFDPVGNRTSSHRSSTYTYQPFNKLTSTQTASYQFDANGNTQLKADSTGYWIYGWDNENRMTTARKQNKIVRYQYDALGRRVSRIGKTLGSTKYTYDGRDVVMDDDFETGISKYQTGPGIDNKLRVQTGTDAKYFLADHLGSTNGLTDTTGALSSPTAYDSFGNQTGSLATRYGFTGRERDDFTGLMYYRARFYDPNLGRFISEDPIGFGGGDINLYGYVRNNPYNFYDPFGLYDGPVNPFRNPFPSGNWVGNGLSNTASDLVDGDGVAQDSWTLGDPCSSGSDMAWAGGRMGVRIGATLLGGTILRAAGRGLAGLVGRIAARPLTNAQLVQKAATIANARVTSAANPGALGTLRHGAATDLLERYQGIYGYRGLDFKVRGPGAVLDVLDTTNGIIYDWKFGYQGGRTIQQLNSSPQMLRYQATFGLPTQVVRP